MSVRVPRWSGLGRGERIRFSIGAVAIGVLLVGIAWIVVTGLLARSELETVRAELPQLRHAAASGNTRKADQLAAELAGHARRAHELTTGPAWWVSSNLPLVGGPMRTGRVVSGQVDTISRSALPDLVRLSRTLTSASIRTGSGINLQPLVASEPTIASASTATTTALNTVVRDTPASTWLPIANDGRQSLVKNLSQLRSDLLNARRGVQTLLPMLGRSTPQRYFIGFMNEAESRGLGGLPGAFAILTVTDGRLRFTHFGNDTELAHVKTNLDLGADFDARYGAAQPTDTYTNSDISPDFSDAARIWAAMWQAKSGQRVTAAIAIDPTALSYLLEVTGPTRVAGGRQVRADNIVALTQQQQYALIANDQARNEFLNKVSAAVAPRLIDGSANTIGLVRAAARGVAERRITVWSADPKVESTIVAAGYGGVLQASDAFTGFTVVNAAGSKLDYYLERTMTYTRSNCAAGATATATLRLTNDAPRTGLPAYVTIRADRHPKGVMPGDNRLLVNYFGSAGAQITSVRIDGKAVPADYATEKGLVAMTVDLELPVRASRTVVVTLREPRPTGPLQILRQPLVRPLYVSTRTCH